MNIEQAYEELRQATDGGSESMTHEDAVASVKYMQSRIYELEHQRELTDEEIHEAIKPLFANYIICRNILEISMDEYRAVLAKQRSIL